MEERGDCDVPGAVEGPRGRPGDPGAVPSDPKLPRLMDDEPEVGKMEDVPPAPPRFRLLRLEAMPPRLPSLVC